MLVLSRKQGEAIVIGDDVTVTVLEVRGDRVRLGFTAPGETPIHREEIHRRMELCVPVGLGAPAFAHA
jgi:carbon storage regulator